ncbi:MAG: zinc-binding dehydrogenase [Firmicutes bacterium]|nr:zinc-binding dehydrogenase [Bacillota bacterium]
MSVVKTGCRYGTHRSLEPLGSLPQPAWKLDNTMDLYASELLINVETLNIDAASFRQISEQAQGDPQQIGKIIVDTVAQRGKQHNPVTGSGGMLIGTVAAIGPKNGNELAPGQRIATLVSLSLTPLHIDRIKAVRPETCQVDIDGQAILFASGIYAVLPEDMPERLALAVLDVAGAPAQTRRLVQPGQTVAVIGAGGKSGLLCMHEARKQAGSQGRVIGLELSESGLERVKSTGYADIVLQADATKAVETMNQVETATDGRMADVVINCVDIPGTEMSSILCCRETGTVYFFSMATSFTAAALGAEGVGKDIQMLIGNGYARGHAEIALNCLRENQALRDIFTAVYA